MSKERESGVKGVEGKKVERVAIKPLNLQAAILHIEGASPLVLNHWSKKSQDAMLAKQMSGSKAKTRKSDLPPKDPEMEFNGARHISDAGWDGLHASAFRNGAISVCRIADFQMTKAKLSIFVEPDGFDRDDAVPLVRITKGTPVPYTAPVVLPTTGAPSIVTRPMWKKWEASVRVRFDADQFTLSDVYNLFVRMGQQVGVGAGRPDSKTSNGLGFGLFTVKKITREAIKEVTKEVVE